MIMPHKVSDFPSPKPFITKCCFCGSEVRLVKDSTEGKKVACFEHSHKFMGALKG